MPRVSNSWLSSSAIPRVGPISRVFVPSVFTYGFAIWAIVLSGLCLFAIEYMATFVPKLRGPVVGFVRILFALCLLASVRLLERLVIGKGGVMRWSLLGVSVVRWDDLGVQWQEVKTDSDVGPEGTVLEDRNGGRFTISSFFAGYEQAAKRVRDELAKRTQPPATGST